MNQYVFTDKANNIHFDIIHYLFLTAIGLTPDGRSTAHIWLTPGGRSTAHIWLTPGGRSTAHIYTQTVHIIQRTEHTST
jgi:hypothetical protein